MHPPRSSHYRGSARFCPASFIVASVSAILLRDYSLKPGHCRDRGRNLVAQVRRWSKCVEGPVRDLVTILKETPDLLKALGIVSLHRLTKYKSARLVEQSCGSQRVVAWSVQQQFNQWQLVGIRTFPQRGLDCNLASNRSQHHGMIEINSGIGISQEQPCQGRPVVRSEVREQLFGLIPCECLPAPSHFDTRSGGDRSMGETFALIVVETFGHGPGVPEESARQ
jgi:hypothetical protein